MSAQSSQHQTPLDARMSATPSLWHWLPRALLYPLRGNALGLLLVFTPLMTLAVFAGLLGIWALVIFGAWSVNYLFSCTERSAMGAAHPPALDATVLNPFDARLAATLLYLGIYGPLLLPLAVVFLPVHLVLVSLRHHIDSLNPWRLIQMLRAMGRNGLIAGAVSLVVAGAISTQIMMAPFPLLIGGILYWLILSAHIAGFSAWHARHELNLASLHELEHDDITRRRDMDRLIETVLLLDRTGKRGQALKKLLAPANAVRWPDQHSYHLAVLHRLLDNGRDRLAGAWTRHMLTRLLNHRQKARVVEVLDLTRQLDARRLPDAARTRLNLARIALEAGRTDLALDVLGSQDGKHPDLDAGHAALLHARLLAEQGNDQPARAILQRLRDHGHAPLMAGVTELEGVLGKVSY